MKSIVYLNIFLLILCCQYELWGQSAAPGDSLKMLEKNLYEAVLFRVQRILLMHTADSLGHELTAEAEVFARSGDWQAGREILNSVLSIYEAPLSEGWEDVLIEAGTSLAGFPEKRSSFRAETGVDYTLQEFEGGLAENDSALVEELQNPYVLFEYQQLLHIARQWVQLGQQLRWDQQFFNYHLLGSMAHKDPLRVRRLDIEGSYFYARTPGNSDFWEGNIAGWWGNPPEKKQHWYIEGRMRFKQPVRNDSLNGQVFAATLNTRYEYLFNPGFRISLGWHPDIYISQQSTRYEALQNRFNMNCRWQAGERKSWEAGGQLSDYRFRNNIDGTAYQNRYLSFQSEFQLEWPVVHFSGIVFRYRGEVRRYNPADAIHPDFENLHLEGLTRFYMGKQKTFGIGYIFETQYHNSPQSEEGAFVSQADYRENGIVLSSEYFSAGGLWIRLEYRFSLQDYPNARDSDLSTFYSNRQVHSLGLTGWIPFAADWQIQVIANYDNDRDRQFERSDRQSTILSLGLSHEF